MKVSVRKVLKIGVVISAIGLVLLCGGIVYLSLSSGDTVGEVSVNLWDRVTGKEHHAHGR